MNKFALTSTIAAAFCLPVAAEMNSPQSARHVLSLNDVEITALIDDVSIITGYTFVLHPDVRRVKVTVMSQAPMSTEDVFQVFLSTLRVHGFAAVPAGKGVYRIIPEQAAIGEAGQRAAGPNTFITEVMRLNNFNAIEAAQMVKPLIDAQGQVIANANSNTLVVVDYASNMPRLRELVAGLESSDTAKMETVSLRNIPAKEMEGILNDLLGQSENGAASNFEVAASASSNAVVVRGNELKIAQAVRISQQLDSTDPVRDTLRVIPLANSTAEEIVPILEKLAQTMSGQAAPGAELQKTATIAHHAPTNSLVISATPDTLLSMERVVAALDQRRAQVLVEAIIVEISDDTARELGVEFLLSGTDGTVPLLSTNFNNNIVNLLGFTGAVSGGDVFTDTGLQEGALNSLLNLEGGNFGVGGESGDTLFGAIVTAVEEDTESQVLSKPFSMVLDNGTSSLVVGQEVPITTGETLGDDNSNPFRTVEREQVGIKLDVTPRISSDDTIRMSIYQEVSSIFGTVNSESSDLITNTREIATDVLVDDGEILVIGGLIEQDDARVAEQVPFLGDLPLLGNLFRSEGKGLQRTNLMVFIRPTIVRDRQSAQDVTQRNYNYIRAEELLRTGEEISTIDNFLNEVLGTTPLNE
ncbi:MAG: type II secretion system secretin GspD [Henriciella sp.]|nr:type II secretion system secretin GspD [Henriciella sp.]